MAVLATFTSLGKTEPGSMVVEQIPCRLNLVSVVLSKLLLSFWLVLRRLGVTLGLRLVARPGAPAGLVRYAWR